MITILVCTAAGLLCAALGWFSGRACSRREVSRLLVGARGEGYKQGFGDGAQYQRELNVRLDARKESHDGE